MNMTKKEFEEILDRKLDQKLAVHTKEIKTFVVAHVDKKINSLAILINKGFQNVQDQLNDQKPYQPWKSKK